MACPRLHHLPATVSCSGSSDGHHPEKLSVMQLLSELSASCVAQRCVALRKLGCPTLRCVGNAGFPVKTLRHAGEKGFNDPRAGIEFAALP
jgi:hypothetical protein